MCPPYFPFLSITGIIPFLSAPFDRFLQLLQNTEHYSYVANNFHLMSNCLQQELDFGGYKEK